MPAAPPIEPMLAKLADELPRAGEWLYEPKWDGFRAIVFRGADDVYIQSRDSRPLDRYFLELHEALLERLPPDCVVDGEIVIATENGLDFDALQLCASGFTLLVAGRACRAAACALGRRAARRRARRRRRRTRVA